MPSQARRYFRFAGFEMDRDALELHKDGQRVPLQIQPFRVLELLVEKAGVAVTRDELRERVWPANVFVDFDHGLNNAVARLREALGDAASEPRFIETLPRIGYRFVYPAADIETEAGVIVGQPEVNRSTRWPWLRKLAAVAIAAALASVVVGNYLRDVGSATRIGSVAVLPFRDLSAPPDASFLGEGMTEALITRLAQHPQVRVLSRRSADRYRDSHVTIADIAADLGVEGIIEGSYVRRDDLLRIDVRLLRAADESHAWAQSYDIGAGDIFRLQDQVADDVLEELGGGSGAVKPNSVARSNDLSAYELYLQGRHLFHQRSREAVTRSLDYFRRAIERDPAFAAAYAGLAESYVTLAGRTLVQSMKAEDVRDEALDAARRALALDKYLAESHGAMGQVLDKLYPRSDDRDVEVETYYRRAIELDPSYSTAFLWLGNFVSLRGRSTEAIDLYRRGMAIDPVSPSILSRLGAELLDHDQIDEGMVLLERAIDIEPYQFNARLRMGWALAALGRLDEAQVSFAVAEEVSPRSHHALGGLAFVAAKKGDEAKARALLAEFQPVADELDTPFLPAIVYVALGDNANALAWLDRSAASSQFLVNPGFFSLDDPVYDGLRNDPAFERIRRKAESAAGNSGT
ncbi:MAG: winged helix-turn-helix domain-containing protein [Gammaproteobacteria bacterium]|nr:winged helix-turn-helix domain-containing protein [Gammaproteobacteria bacterium]MDH5344667.1 winged helix-turn-helix domain-containing protein [Gammaproteobacteria bacterium]